MNNTTTYSRSMFGLTEVNADTINANNLVLTGPLSVDLIQSTAAGQSLTLEALGAANLIFKTNGTTQFNIGTSSITSSVYITAPTEVAGSNNTRLATTQFVTTANTNSINNLLAGTNAWTGTNTFNTNLPTSSLTPSSQFQLTPKSYVDFNISGIFSGTNSWTGTNTFNSNLPTSTITPTSGTQLVNKTYADSIRTNLLTGTNNWTGNNAFNTNLPTSTATPITGTQLVTKTYVDGLVGTGILGSNNTWTGTNTYNSFLPTSTITPTTSSQFTTKTYVDSSISTSTTNLLSGTNNWSGTNTFNTNLPTSTLTPTTTTQLTTKTYVDSAISTSTTNLLAATNTWTGTSNTFNSNVIVGTGKTLALPNYPSVEAKLSETVYEDTFIDSFATNPITWSSGGTGGVGPINDEVGHQGIVRMTASNDRLLYPTNATNIFYWDAVKRMEFVFRVNFTDTNMFYGAGLSDNNVGTANNIVWVYFNGIPNGWSLRVNGLYPTGGNAGLMGTTTGDWFYGIFLNTGGQTIRVYLKNLTRGNTFDWQSGTIASISTTALYRPYFRVTNTSGAGTKSIDIDYVNINYVDDKPISPI